MIERLRCLYGEVESLVLAQSMKLDLQQFKTFPWIPSVQGLPHPHMTVHFPALTIPVLTVFLMPGFGPGNPNWGSFSVPALESLVSAGKAGLERLQAE